MVGYSSNGAVAELAFPSAAVPGKTAAPKAIHRLYNSVVVGILLMLGTTGGRVPVPDHCVHQAGTSPPRPLLLLLVIYLIVMGLMELV